jgi:S1-C subfamily serine protease
MPASKSPGSSTLSDLSTQLAGAVEAASSAVIAIHARRRIPSSGILWRDDIIVSASHTVRLDDDIKVTLADGKAAQATIVGRDPSTDVIALRLKQRTGVKAGARGDAAELRVGSLVLAVGRPGKNATASFGIVSAVGDGWRSWEGARIDRILRLDLAVYDGFSGGALVDPQGRVVGMNNSALARGSAMALAGDTIDKVVDELVDRGHVRRPYVGVAVQPVTRSGEDAALLVVSVADGSPASKAGIVLGDVLLTAGGTELRHPTDLLDAIWTARDGKSIELKLLRGGAAKTVSIAPADRGGA